MKESKPLFTVGKEKAILMALASDQRTLEKEVLPSLDELAALTETCGGEVVAVVTQLRPAREAAFYLGKGKIDEIKDLGAKLEADLLICDDELTGSQMRRLEAMTGLRVLDRTLVILDIFAKRAQSREGKIQVELAQQEYRLSRLTQEEGELSRLGGGIGTRGPGETKLESDRRHIHRRINQLKNDLVSVAEHRERLRAARRRSGSYTVAVVGYTNAGKTTLVNNLCKADLTAANQLFATLDPAARKMNVTSEEIFAVTQDYSCYFAPVLVDTVGFIRRLPHTLINAFHSTLQEATEADILLHVVNAADKEAVRQFEVAEKLLRELGADKIPGIIVLNKVDLITSPEQQEQLAALTALAHHTTEAESSCVEISAKNGEGLSDLRRLILQRCYESRRSVLRRKRV